MTLTTLYPPIAAATVLNCFLFAAAWRAHKQEKQGRAAPWWFVPGFLVYAGCAGAFFYLSNGRQLAGWPDYFGAAVVGQAMGVVVVYGLLSAFIFTRGQPWPRRIALVGAAIFLVTLLVLSAFKT